MILRHDVVDGVRLAAVFDDRGQMAALYAQPDDERAWLGDIYTAQITRYAPAQRAYFLDLGSDGEGFLPHDGDGVLQPGQKIVVCVERPATRQKKIRCSLLEGEPEAVLGRMEHGADVILQAQNDYPSAVVNDSGLEDYDDAILSLLQPHVQVKQGVDIVIETMTALTAIDVNNADPDMTPLEVNRLVTKVLAHELRLRNIGGQIVVDYLRLRDPKHRAALETSIQQAVTLDPCQVQLYGFTRLGLFEMVRAKRGLPLAEIFALCA